MSGPSARYALCDEDRPLLDRRPVLEPELELPVSPPSATVSPPIAPPTLSSALPVALALDIGAIERWRGEFNAALDDLLHCAAEQKRGIVLTSLTRIEQLAGHGRKLLEAKRREP
jgi:hypothetical protein